MREKYINETDDFDQMYERLIKSVNKRDPIIQYNEKWPEKADGSRDLRVLRTIYTERQFCMVPVLYSRGDQLSDIKELFIDALVDHYIFLCNEIDKYTSWPIYNLYNRPDNYSPYADGVQNRYHSVYCWLCWMICLGADAEKLGRITPYLCESGKDRLIDTIAKRFEPNRKVAVTCMNPETFGLLDQVIDAEPLKRIELVTEYLNNWPKYIGMLNGLKSIGVANTYKVRVKKDLIKNINNYHVGFWAWEVALVVKFFQIDDTSFKDHEFYPYEMVHFLDEE